MPDTPDYLQEARQRWDAVAALDRAKETSNGGVAVAEKEEEEPQEAPSGARQALIDMMAKREADGGSQA